VAEKFAEEHGNTLIVMTSDHETGGLTLGRNPPGNSHYPEYAWHPSVVNRCTRSSTRVGELLLSNKTLCCQPNSTLPLVSRGEIATAVRNAAEEGLGLPVNNLTAGEVGEIVTAMEGVWSGSERSDFVFRLLGMAVSVRAEVGWTTWGHTGADVQVYARFPTVEKDSKSTDPPDEKPWTSFSGLKNNIEVGAFVAEQFGLDLAEQTKAIRGFDPTDGGKGRRRAQGQDYYGFHD
jgi:alkaline phosphatase